MERKKKVADPQVPQDEPLRERIAAAGPHQIAADAMQKDVHLIEAALATDRIVISLDDTVRRLFAGASVNIRELRPVVWANPATEGEELLNWIKAGAKDEKERRLGHARTARK